MSVKVGSLKVLSIRGCIGGEVVFKGGIGANGDGWRCYG